MALSDVEIGYAKKFFGKFRMLLQQMDTRLRGTVEEIPLSEAEEGFIDFVGSADWVKLESRHADTPNLDIPQDRRKVFADPYVFAKLIDKRDKLRSIENPAGAFMKGAVSGGRRKFDDVIIAGALATAYTGKEGATAVPFDDTNQKIVHGNALVTVDKILEANEILEADENDETDEGYFVWNAKAKWGLIKSADVKSRDFDTIKALAEGRLDKWLNFRFIRSERLPIAGGIRTCIAYKKSGINLVVSEDMTERVTERDDKNFAVQIYTSIDIGAVRTEEKKVIKIESKEA